MRKLKIMKHISLDGVIQHSSDGNDFPYSDWTMPYRTPAGRDAVLAAHGENFDLLLGRRTYDIWSGFWPKAPNSPMADGINAAMKYVATHRPQSLEWGPSESLGPDIVDGIRRIRSHDGPNLILWGNSTLTNFGARRTWARGRRPARRLPGFAGNGQALLRAGNVATFLRARQHDSDAVGRRPQHLQG